MNSQLELAEQQFIGYAHAKAGYGIELLASGMGLTAVEWEEIKGMEGHCVSEDEVAALDDYFAKLKIGD